MPDLKLSQLSALATPDNADLLLAVDVSDTSMGSSGTDKKVTVANLIATITAGLSFQPLDSDLTAIAALSTTSFGRGLLALADGAAVLAAIGAQASDSDLTAIAALTTTSFGRSLLTQADAAATRTTLSAAAASHTHPESDVTNLTTDLAALTAALSVVTANLQTANYTLVLTDAGKCVEINNASARTVTVPPHSSVAWPTDTVIELHRYAAGTVTVAPGSGVTIRSPGSLLSLASQYSTGALRYRGSDEWVLSGDLA